MRLTAVVSNFNSFSGYLCLINNAFLSLNDTILSHISLIANLTRPPVKKAKNLNSVPRNPTKDAKEKRWVILISIFDVDFSV